METGQSRSSSTTTLVPNETDAGAGSVTGSAASTVKIVNTTVSGADLPPPSPPTPPTSTPTSTPTPTPQPIGIGLSPQPVGREFVRQYYTVMSKSPQMLHRFYAANSTLTFCNSPTIVGQEQIRKDIEKRGLRDCHTRIFKIDAQPTLANGVVVQVVGELSNNNEPLRSFTQTFVLTPLVPKNFFVHNEIFRYQDDLQTDVSLEPLKIDHALGAVTGYMATPAELWLPSATIRAFSPVLTRQVLAISKSIASIAIQTANETALKGEIEPVGMPQALQVEVVLQPLKTAVETQTHGEHIAAPITATTTQTIAAQTTTTTAGKTTKAEAATNTPTNIEESLKAENENDNDDENRKEENQVKPISAITIMPAAATTTTTVTVTSATTTTATTRPTTPPITPITTQATTPSIHQTKQEPSATSPATPAPPASTTAASSAAVPPLVTPALTYANVFKSSSAQSLKAATAKHMSTTLPDCELNCEISTTYIPSATFTMSTSGNSSPAPTVEGRMKTTSPPPDIKLKRVPEKSSATQPTQLNPSTQQTISSNNQIELRKNRYESTRNRYESGSNRNNARNNSGFNTNNSNFQSQRRTRQQYDRYDDNLQLFLGNLPLSATVDDLTHMFERYGSILELRVLSKSPQPGQRKLPNYGFLTFASTEAVERCLNDLPFYFPENSDKSVRLNVRPKNETAVVPPQQQQQQQPQQQQSTRTGKYNFRYDNVGDQIRNADQSRFRRLVKGAGQEPQNGGGEASNVAQNSRSSPINVQTVKDDWPELSPASSGGATYRRGNKK